MALASNIFFYPLEIATFNSSGRSLKCHASNSPTYSICDFNKQLLDLCQICLILGEWSQKPTSFANCRIKDFFAFLGIIQIPDRLRVKIMLVSQLYNARPIYKILFQFYAPFNPLAWPQSILTWSFFYSWYLSLRELHLFRVNLFSLCPFHFNSLTELLCSCLSLVNLLSLNKRGD